MASVHDQSAVLYQSTDREIILIDIPKSIAASQGRSDTLLSTPPLEEPLQPKEEYRPRNNKNASVVSADTERHQVYKSLIQQALLDIHAHVSGPWCAPRKELTQLPKYGEDVEKDDPERRLELQFREWTAGEQKPVDDVSFDFQTMMASLGAPEVQPAAANPPARQWRMSYSPVNTPEQTVETEWRPAFHNPHNHPVRLSITQDPTESEPSSQAYHFIIPAQSTFYLSTCDHPDTFRTSFRTLTATYNLPRHFDLVLLDPPWPNRSAKRKGAYEQIGGMPYLKKLLLKMDLDNYLEHNALVGIWITNKTALRSHVLELFSTWNVGLVEEWVWIKTTTKGEPMFNIDDPMRKPYELLLLGRAAPNAWTAMKHVETPRRRVVAAVPDVHSRKPCLKALLEPCAVGAELAGAGECRALEVFARCVVEGWTAWGNEVVKFNEGMYWVANGGVDV